MPTEPTILPAHPNGDDCLPCCPFCGGVMVDDGELVVCGDCQTAAPVGAEWPAEVARS